MSRKKIIAGNWKMNMLPNEAINFVSDLEPLIKDTKCEVVICAPYIDLFYVLLNAQGTNIKVGAENLFYEESGAYTGEVSGKMLKSVGMQYVIVGHSERRKYFNETDEIVNKKVKSAIKNNLKPILCVGETLEEREQGKQIEVVTSQTRNALEGLSAEEVKNVVIAYEPVWAIGTGKTCAADDANTSIKSIREEVKNLYGKSISDSISILYGGSVKPENAKELFTKSDIDGGLIGGASLKAEDFAKIINYNK